MGVVVALVCRGLCVRDSLEIDPQRLSLSLIVRNRNLSRFEREKSFALIAASSNLECPLTIDGRFMKHIHSLANECYIHLIQDAVSKQNGSGQRNLKFALK